ALRAMRVWFALSWVVSLACLKGLTGARAAFLRTPKRREEEAGWLHAIRSAKAETLISFAGLLGAIGMVVASPYPSTIALAALLLFQSLAYANGPWAGLAAEGIELTPLRRKFLASGQNLGDWPSSGRAPGAVPAVIAAVGVVLTVLAVLGSPASEQAPSAPILPPVGGPPQASPSPTASPSQAPPSPSP